jgi:hypothetical protein
MLEYVILDNILCQVKYYWTSYIIPDNISCVARVQKVVWYWVCERCGHEWPPKGESEPKNCPKCKSPYWNTPRKISKKAANGKVV